MSADVIESLPKNNAAEPQEEPQFHPLAELFPLMEGAELDALVADIRAHGLVEPIILYEDKILDGRNRYLACGEAGVEPTYRPFMGDDPFAFVVSANLRRRHLTIDQKRDLAAKLLARDPTLSDRQIGKMVGLSKNTAADVRHESEGRGQIDHVETRIDSKGRRQPAKKARGAEPGQLTDDVRKLVAAAGAGEPASAVARAAELTGRPKCQPAAVGLNPTTFADAPLPERTKYLDAIGPEAFITALPLGWLEAMRAWVVAHDAPALTAPASNSDAPLPHYVPAQKDPWPKDWRNLDAAALEVAITDVQRFGVTHRLEERHHRQLARMRERLNDLRLEMPASLRRDPPRLLN